MPCIDANPDLIGVRVELIMKVKYGYNSGFTLTEIMIVVAIIGLLAAIAIPNFAKSRRRAQQIRFVNDLRMACDAFETYAMVHGTYPPDTMPRVVPDGMAVYFERFHWEEDTTIGGQWDWDNGQFGFKAGVSVYQPTYTDEQMEEIDKIIDDGDLSTGGFRKRSQGFIRILQ